MSREAKGALTGETRRVEQVRLHSAAASCFGLISGRRPDRAETGRLEVRKRIARRNRRR